MNDMIQAIIIALVTVLFIWIITKPRRGIGEVRKDAFQKPDFQSIELAFGKKIPNSMRIFYQSKNISNEDVVIEFAGRRIPISCFEPIAQESIRLAKVSGHGGFVFATGVDKDSFYLSILDGEWFVYRQIYGGKTENLGKAEDFFAEMVLKD